MTEPSPHEQMVNRLRSGVSALARHTEATTNRVAQYLTPSESAPSESENQQ